MSVCRGSLCTVREYRGKYSVSDWNGIPISPCRHIYSVSVWCQTFICRESLTQQDFFCLWSRTFTWMLTQENTRTKIFLHMDWVRAISSTRKSLRTSFRKHTRQTVQPCTLSGARLDAQVRFIVHTEICIQLSTVLKITLSLSLNCPNRNI